MARKMITRSAEFSPCRTWRYRLIRVWDITKANLAVIGLNPSTADEVQDDPTIRRCMGFADEWGFGGICMLNIFAYRATDPSHLKLINDPIGKDNDRNLLNFTLDHPVLCAWGIHGSLMGRGDEVRELLKDRYLMHLGLTKSGEPRHPLYLKRTEKLRSFAK